MDNFGLTAIILTETANSYCYIQWQSKSGTRNTKYHLGTTQQNIAILIAIFHKVWHKCPNVPTNTRQEIIALLSQLIPCLYKTWKLEAAHEKITKTTFHNIRYVWVQYLPISFWNAFSLFSHDVSTHFNKNTSWSHYTCILQFVMWSTLIMWPEISSLLIAVIWFSW